MRASLILFVVLTAATSVCHEAFASSRIVNGVATHDFPTAGALLATSSGNPGQASMICSGTLIGCRTFLTASHCVVGDPNPSHYFVFLQNAGVFSVSSVVPHPEYRDATFPLADVTIITLGSEVTGIEPTAVNDTDPEPFIPHAGGIVGFGQTLGGAGDYGIKRAGAVMTEHCDTARLEQAFIYDAGDTELVCWFYEAPVGPPGDDSNTCNGDSGGPLFLDLGSGQVVAGVTSGGIQPSCGTDDHSFDANVFNYRAFVLDRLGADSTSACGPIPAVGDGSVSVIGDDGTLGPGNANDSYSVSLSAHTNVLRFVLNAEENGSLRADLYVRQGAPATITEFDCKADGLSNYGACEFELPALDTWYVLVHRVSGSGDYQLTTTIFGGPAPVCGNDVTETGEQCDGLDDGRCASLCNVGSCQCPPPSCGNDVTEDGEQCDGADASACLSASCEPDCTCTPACGDEICNGDETAFSCSADCGCSAPGSCPFGEAPGGCFCDGLCESFGDCCPDACVACAVCTPGCGNGILELSEECDDGNTEDGDCCSSACTLDAPGTSCDDGTTCTSDDQCDGAGNCVGQVAVATGCFEAGSGAFQITDKEGTRSDKLKLTWLRGEVVTEPDFGDPATDTDYELCVFDFTSATPSLAVSASVSPGAHWKQKPGKGWKYRDPASAAEGVQSVMLKVGSDGKSKAKLKARGNDLTLPGAADPPVYFFLDPSLVVQLSNDAGRCWNIEFNEAKTSRVDKFIAKFP